MALTPATSDPEYIPELMRRAKDPISFGAGGLTDEQKKAAEARIAELKKAEGSKK